MNLCLQSGLNCSPRRRRPWPRNIRKWFRTRSVAFSHVKAFRERLPSRDGFVALSRLTTIEPLERWISRVSFTTEMAHHYTSYESASERFFEDRQVCCQEPKLAVRGRNEASLIILSSPRGSGKYCGSFDSAFGSDPGERRSGNLL